MQNSDTRDIERSLLHVFLTDPTALKMYLHMTNEGWFKESERKFIYDELKKTFEDTKSLFTDILFQHKLDQKVDKSKHEIYKNEWKLILGKVPTETPEALIHALTTHDTANKMMVLLTESADLIDKGEVDKALSTLRSGSVTLGTTHGEKKVQEIREYENYRELILDKRVNPKKYTGIKTGFERFDNQTGGLFPAEMTLVSAVTGVGKCSTERATCYSKNGSMTIKEIFEKHIQQKVHKITFDGGEWFRAIPDKPIKILGQVNGKMVFQRVKGLYRERANKLATIKLRDNSFLEAGLNHKYLTPSGWKCVKDLKAKKDWIAVASKVNIPNGEEINHGLVELLAWNIGEGSETSCNRLTITQDNLSVLSYIKDMFDGLGFKCIGSKYKEPYVRHRTKDNSNSLNINSKDFREHLRKEFGYEYGVRSGQKTIPSRIQNCHQEGVRKFLKAYWDAEGCCNDNNLELTSKSRELIESLRYMMRRFGILVITNSKLAKTKKGLERYWRIVVSGKNARTFKKEIGFLYSDKHDDLVKLCDRKCNPNVGSAVPCKKLLQELMELTDLRWLFRRAGLGGSYYSKKDTKHPSKEMIRKVIGEIDTVLNKGWDKIGDSPRKPMSIKSTERNKKRIIEIRNQLNFLSSEDITWLEVQSVETKECNEWLYDLEMEGEPNYLLDLAFSHNSTIIKQIAWNVVKTNKNVLHITNEENHDQVMLKYYSLITDTFYKYLKNPQNPDFTDNLYANWDTLMQKLKNDGFTGKLFIKEIPQFTSAALIEKAVVELEQKGHKIDLIAIDYMDHMAPIQKSWSEYDEQGKVAADMKGLSISCNVPVITATQAATIAEAKQEKGRSFGKLDVYGTKRKVHVANTLIYVIQESQDIAQSREQGGSREEWECDWFWEIQIAKNRDGPPFKFNCRQHVRTGKVEQIADPSIAIQAKNLKKEVEKDEKKS